jgi:hypothetical protein
VLLFMSCTKWECGINLLSRLKKTIDWNLQFLHTFQCVPTELQGPCLVPLSKLSGSHLPFSTFSFLPKSFSLFRNATLYITRYLHTFPSLS